MQAEFRDARAAVERGDHAGALAALLKAWRKAPNDRIAEVIDQVSAIATRGAAPIEGKNQDAKVKAAIAVATDPLQLPRVMELLHDLQRKKAVEVLEAVAEGERDPRILPAALALLAKPPFVGSASLPFWRRLVDLVGAQGDPRARAAIGAVDFSGLTAWQQQNLKEMVARLEAPKQSWPDPTPHELSAEAAAACDAIVAALGVQTADGDTLLARIYAQPGDDAARTVYADWLEEQGDPRGAFITAQLASADRAATEAERRTIANALEAHAKRWLGGLANAVRVQFARGFPFAVAVHDVQIPELVAAPEAATLEEVWVQGQDQPVELEALRALPNLRMVGGLRAPAITRLLDGKTWPWRGIGFDLYDGRRRAGADELRAEIVAKTRTALPALRELAIDAYTYTPPELAFVLDRRLVDGLERLRFGTKLASAPFWYTHTGLPASLVELEVSYDYGFMDWTCRFTRGEDGALSKLLAIARTAQPAPSLDELASAVLDELPTDRLTELEVRAEGVRVQHALLDAIARAATRHTRLARVTLPGRDPFDPRGKPAAKRAKDVAADTRDTALAAFQARLRDLADPEVTTGGAAKGASAKSSQSAAIAELAAIDTAQWHELETFQRVLALVPAKLDGPWADAVVAVLGVPRPEPEVWAWERALKDFAQAVAPRLAGVKQLWARLQPIGLRVAGGLFEACNEDSALAKRLFGRAELPAILDWYETLTILQCEKVYGGLGDVLAAQLDAALRADLEERLASHKLHRWHKWTYASALPKSRKADESVKRGKSR